MSQKIDQTDPSAAQAAYLGNLRAALLEQGFNDNQTFSLCSDAARNLFGHGAVEISRLVSETA